MDESTKTLPVPDAWKKNDDLQVSSERTSFVRIIGDTRITFRHNEQKVLDYVYLDIGKQQPSNQWVTDFSVGLKPVVPGNTGLVEGLYLDTFKVRFDNSLILLTLEDIRSGSENDSLNDYIEKETRIESIKVLKY